MTYDAEALNLDEERCYIAWLTQSIPHYSRDYNYMDTASDNICLFEIFYLSSRRAAKDWVVQAPRISHRGQKESGSWRGTGGS